MSKSRLELQTFLENIIGNKNVYFQPPETIKMNYPAIVYSINKIENKFANNYVYKQDRAYKLVVIDKKPDSEILTKISKLQICVFDTFFTSENLNHTVFTLYY